MADIHRLFGDKGDIVGDGAIVEPDQVLENAKTALTEVIVIGLTPKRRIYVAASHGIRDAIYLVELGKAELMELARGK